MTSLEGKTAVAEVCVFVLERPRHFRMLETALQPMTEQSWG